MKSGSKTTDDLLRELEETRRQLYEATETIEAIRTGQVDALVVQNGAQHQLYTLKTADHSYRVFIEKMTEGAVTLNREGLILYANSQFAKMLGLLLSQVLGFSFQQFIARDSQPIYEALFKTCWKEDGKGEAELHFNEKIVPVQLSFTPLELAEGVSLSIIITDLTSQRATQKLLKDNNQELEQLNKTLESSNHDLQQFASVASHDLQEPLRKIQMFTNTIKNRWQTRPGDENDMRDLDKVIASVSRMRTLIIDVLNYSKLSANDGEFADTDLNIVLEEIMEDLDFVIEEKGARIIATPLPVLTVNRGQMRQVFQNLISNALKFSKPGQPPVIEITAKHVAERNFDSEEQRGGPYCLICIKDNGIGFDEKYAPTIFSLFERLNPKHQYEGTGIGLAITKKIVEKHMGLIQVKSMEGIGSEFRIILPCQID